MKQKIRGYFITAGILLLSFFALMLLLLTVDVQPSGPMQSYVGLATVNEFVFKLLGVNLLWYSITDWLGIAAICVAFGFAVLGVFQMIKRRSFRGVDKDILVLGGFYIAVIAVYLLFEICIVNYRPITLGEGPEASFPSSHTMIILCIMTTAIIQFRKRIRGKAARTAAESMSVIIIIVTVIGRFISGVHWFTDIIGGMLLGFSLNMFYLGIIKWIEFKNKKHN
ncbi:phosphatase PAP2 family protein [Ruminococcus sp. OA3]|uniref:phosphatase PAP2 family protein n=1 Tax=Ruminococcus sp. OA3 TaxID=2914164 RepID=UPI001F05D0CC|nr:phosphatase PAP2 family protein [Ruminococcus sp. OA3]MCH1984364.1 phosphatase PAP2 family protein [Ruminococcus sp. OA3]